MKHWDFAEVNESIEKGIPVIKLEYRTDKRKDLMTLGGDFHAVWDWVNNEWTTDEERFVVLGDSILRDYISENKERLGNHYRAKFLSKSSSKAIDEWHHYVKEQLRVKYHQLDEKLIFSDQTTTKEDYSTKRLPYALKEAPTPAWDELKSTLYSEENVHKIEFYIGSVVAGASKDIQKFVVFYGEGGTGKSTILNIICKLFDGYWKPFIAKDFVSANNQFPLEPLSTNPLVGIQHDGDLSNIKDNSILNSLVSHEVMSVNTKNKKPYPMRFNTFLFMGTNKTVEVTDANSGIIRRLIDISPTGKKIKAARYNELMAQIEYELGGIAYHCREVYLADPSFYNTYVPVRMLSATNHFYNFILENYEEFVKEDGISLARAWMKYNKFCEDGGITERYKYPKTKFIVEMQSYFKEYIERIYTEEGVRVRNYYRGFISDKFMMPQEPEKPKEESWIIFDKTESLFTKMAAGHPAQYGVGKDLKPGMAWDNVTTCLGDISDKKLHYVRMPINHIVVDFDIKDPETGKKSFELNKKAASKFPPTYGELSKSGQGIHLHYIYTGDPTKLSCNYGPEIEVKVFTGKSSLRRQLSYCNDIPVATLSSGLPLKEEKQVVSDKVIKDEFHLRNLITKAMLEMHHKPAIDWIDKLLSDAYANGMHYDLSELYSALYDFAMESHNHPDYCTQKVANMKFMSADISEPVDTDSEGPITFFDDEVTPNHFLVVAKELGAPREQAMILLDPTPEDLERFHEFGKKNPRRLVGFNNLRYDNDMHHARLLGYSAPEIFDLSTRKIAGDRTAAFRESKNYSFTDIYDYSSEKMGLKKWEIRLHQPHKEFPMKWDEPVPDEMLPTLIDYCLNDVMATEAVWNATQSDFKARQMLAAITGMTPNDTTNNLTTRLIFGNERNPVLVYTDLATGEQY